ncbi:MAG: hypothetical protein JW929_02920 [Anaerolineales bacterium]|nr:hypothetical protein [Anaerolineales bacterium]
MTRIRMDTDLLFKNADAIHAIGERFRRDADSLLSRIQGVGSACPDLAASARKDALEAQQWILSLSLRLETHAEMLAALANAFKSIDEETIAALIAAQGEGWFRQTYFPVLLYPDPEGFTPYYLPQTRVWLSDWVPVYVQGVQGLRQVATYHTGRLVTNVVGEWTDPRTGKGYYVADLGGGQFVYIPKSKNSAAVDLSLIPNREGSFTDGQQVADPPLPPPFGPDGRDPAWYLPGDPWQNLILGNMDIDGIGGGRFPDIPHTNLCGELSVLFAVGETDLEGGLSRFAQLRGLGYWNSDGTKTEYHGTQVLQNTHHTTSAYDLKRLFEECGYEAQISNGGLPPPDVLAAKIQSGHSVVVLTELDTRREIFLPSANSFGPNPTYGQLVPGAAPQTPGRAAHWVTVTDVFQDGGGDIFVEVFNPYSGSKETYTWDTFVKTCQQPGSQTAGSYTYVEAVKP